MRIRLGSCCRTSAKGRISASVLQLRRSRGCSHDREPYRNMNLSCRGPNRYRLILSISPRLIHDIEAQSIVFVVRDLIAGDCVTQLWRG